MLRFGSWPAVLALTVVLAACGGTASSGSPAASVAPEGSDAPAASASAAPSDAPTPSPKPAASATPGAALPDLPDGWTRHEVSGEFSVGLPAGWLAMTAAERDDTTAADALKEAFPDYTQAIDQTLAAMRDQGLLLHAFDVTGDTSVFTTNVNVLKIPGPLDAAFAAETAASLLGQYGVTEAPEAEAAPEPPGAWRYQFTAADGGTEIAGGQYLVPSGDDVYVLTFLTTPEQAPDYGPVLGSIAATFAVAGAGSAAAPTESPTTVAATTDGAAPAALDPSAYDPETGQVWGPHLEDACVLLTVDAIRTASGYSDVTRDPTTLVDGCNWVYSDGSGVDVTVFRFIDAEHARAAIVPPADEAAAWEPLDGVGDGAVIDRAGGDSFAVVGDWVVFVGAGSSAPSTTRGAVVEALLPLAVANLPG